MLEELKKEYKELGEARTKFCNNVTSTFIELYKELNEKLAQELWDISLTTTYHNRFVGIVVTLNNIEDCTINQFPSSKFILFNMFLKNLFVLKYNFSFSSNSFFPSSSSRFSFKLYPSCE